MNHRFHELPSHQQAHPAVVEMGYGLFYCCDAFRIVQEVEMKLKEFSETSSRGKSET